MSKTIHLVFKTHLDIGFTDLSANIVDEYINNYIPKAISTIKELEQKEEKLSWITGSWLINHYLNVSSVEKQQELESLINKGYIGYHGLPFTTHTELMNKRLFNYGLSLYKNLDKRFNKQTISAKMTDVPGHTKAMIPLLAASGIKFLHIGVNTGSAIPSVPPIFNWVADDGSSIIVQYSSNYGAEYKIPGVDDLLIIENNADNCEPPSPFQVINTYKELKEKYPDYNIIPSNLDNYAKAILPYSSNLPIITDEIGDTWIHGVGTDPKKVFIYKKLLAYGEKLIKEKKLIENSKEYNNFYSSLLMIPEHTWGLDTKKYLPDYSNWSIDEFQNARKKNFISLDNIPLKYKVVEDFTKIECAKVFKNAPNKRDHLTYSFFESSHKEQRSYLTRAINSLENKLQDGWKIEDNKIKKSINNCFVDNNGLIVLDYFKCQFSYQTFSSEDYNIFNNTYNRNFKETWAWCCSDFGKPGMEFTKPTPISNNYFPLLISSEKNEFKNTVTLEMEEKTPKSCPSSIKIIISELVDENSISIKCSWKNKVASRLPEAMWFSFFTNDKDYKIKKLGSYIDPFKVVYNGSRSIHAIEEIKGKNLIIKAITTPLVSLGEKKLLKFDNELPLKNGIFHFNIFNNIWGTNFPQWYEDDGSAEFVVSFNT